jgi:hypothetical protein
MRNLGIVGVDIGLAGVNRLSLASEARHWLREAIVPTPLSKHEAPVVM